MSRKTWIWGRAEVRTVWQRWITAVAAWGNDVRPWKRAVAWVCVVANIIGFTALAVLHGHPLWYLGAVVGAGAGLEYIKSTDRIPPGKGYERVNHEWRYTSDHPGYVEEEHVSWQ